MEDKKQKIEDLAWQLFQDKLGISFKTELNDVQKKSITDKKEYQYYRDTVIKIYDKLQIKKEKALLNKKYPVIEVPADGRSGMGGGAYVLCFVYSKHDGNFVLSGFMREVEEYLKKNHKYYFCNYSLWWHGQNRDIWKFWKEDIGIHEPHRYSKIFTGNSRWKFQVRPYVLWNKRTDRTDKEADEKALWFKRMPKRWIPEFDNF